MSQKVVSGLASVRERRAGSTCRDARVIVPRMTASRADLRSFGVDLFDRWTAMWNGDLAVASQIMAPDFTLRYAQANTPMCQRSCRLRQRVSVGFMGTGQSEKRRAVQTAIQSRDGEAVAGTECALAG